MASNATEAISRDETELMSFNETEVISSAETEVISLAETEVIFSSEERRTEVFNAIMAAKGEHVDWSTFEGRITASSALMYSLQYREWVPLLYQENLVSSFTN